MPDWAGQHKHPSPRSRVLGTQTREAIARLAMANLLEPDVDEVDMSEGSLLGPASDPDAQATVSDFIDYTEYLPADLQRSLTLIGDLDARYLQAAQAVHQLTRTYGALPSLPKATRPNAVDLRRQISEQLHRAISARECAYAEARRLYDVVDRHFDRLGCIRTKLEGLGKSMLGLDSAADQESSARPEAAPARATVAPNTPTRLTLRLDSKENAVVPKLEQAEPEKKPIPLRLRVRADQEAAGHDSDVPTGDGEEDDADLDEYEAASRHVRPPASNAPKGSQQRPWLQLTELELARLRKRMKKNNTWQPSEVMINRELAMLGRGWEDYQRAREQGAAGPLPADLDRRDATSRPTRTLRSRGEGRAGSGAGVTGKDLARKRKLEEAVTDDNHGISGGEQRVLADDDPSVQPSGIAKESDAKRPLKGQSYMHHAPNPDTPVLKRTCLGSRRSKRPAPGPVTASQDGGTAVSVGRRKAKPRSAEQSGQTGSPPTSEQATSAAEVPDGTVGDAVLEPVDPNEPRYCICGDVSFGTMICCEDENCDKEWFHLECVGLTEVPNRSAKWYCPECRVKIAKVPADGIIRTTSRR
ncbi:hypothetical protein KEM52_005314 [Ascosphaera acerosa]|nr:hypothetical protein KEM52_005314 [Ascosphaera acerosa]